MLAGGYKDAINICLRQLDDWQMAIALARVVEGGTEGPLYRSILSETVVPLAFEGGHRWLATWAFWLLGRRDLAVRVLIVSPPTVTERLGTIINGRSVTYGRGRPVLVIRERYRSGQHRERRPQPTIALPAPQVEITSDC